MIRIVLVAVVFVLLLVTAGMVVLGAFPPGPRTEQVQKVLPKLSMMPVSVAKSL